MNVLCFDGGLGNQMFQYAFYLSIKKRAKGIWLYDISGAKYHHNGFELDKIFGVCEPVWMHNCIIKNINRLISVKCLTKEKSGIYFNEVTPINSIGKYVEYKGFWQSEKYFLDVEKDVRNTFRFDLSKLNDTSKLVIKKITKDSRKYVSLHVRRGDYMNDPERQVCSLEYYKHAMAYIKAHVLTPVFIIFSDDIKWCRTQFGDDCEYVNWNTGVDSWQDMCLMSACAHHIIANSSFSWWGAWLNDNKNKIVICPKYWNVGFPLDTDRMPNDWVRL